MAEKIHETCKTCGYLVIIKMHGEKIDGYCNRYPTQVKRPNAGTYIACGEYSKGTPKNLN